MFAIPLRLCDLAVKGFFVRVLNETATLTVQLDKDSEVFINVLIEFKKLCNQQIKNLHQDQYNDD